MLDKLKIVYVVSWMPSFEGASTGGFDWYPSEDDARMRLINHLVSERGKQWAHDYTIRSMLVPMHYSNEEITAALDTEYIEFRELPLPPEWTAIRELGGAIDLTDDKE